MSNKPVSQVTRRVHSPLIGIIYALQCNVLVIVKESIELGTQSVESEFLQEKLYVCPD